MEFKRTTAINKILRLNARKKVIQGGSSAGKTYGIIPILIDKAAKTSNLEISVVSESIPHLKKGALKDFIKIMKSTGRWIDSHYNATDRKYTFSNGSYIEFFSPESVLGARRHILYVNEANNITYEDYHQLSVRTENDIYIDFNPANEFWAHTEVLKEPDSESLILTYLDNEGRPTNVDLEFEIARQKSAKEKEQGVDGYWSNWCRVYIDGQIGSLQGVVFNNWHQIDDIPKDAEFVGRGLDFGFTNDPTALLEVYKSFNKLYVKELLYETRLTGYDIAERMLILNIPKHQVIVGDCARPETIEDLRRFGFNIEPSIKGADSVINSIDTLQQFEIYVTKDSTNLIKELRSYRWLTDRSGKPLNEPIDHNNHCFTGDTLITTINGYKRIDSINIGDYVLTSMGYKKVLKRWNNGLKQVNKYLMRLDTFDVYLWSTHNHLIKTDTKWTQISKLQSEQKVYQHKYLTVKNTGYTQENIISQGEEKECTQMYGNIIMAKFLNIIMYIIRMTIVGIITLITLNWLKATSIYQNTVENGLRTIKSGLLYFIQEVLKKQKTGIGQKKGENGTKNTGKKVGLTENTECLIVKNVEKNTKQDILVLRNSAITTVRLKHLEKGESKVCNVYDLYVEDCHEYFANGILVHNCIDALRYIASNRLHKSEMFDVY